MKLTPVVLGLIPSIQSHLTWMECPNDKECDLVGEMCCPVSDGSKVVVMLCTPVNETRTPSEAPYPPYLAKIYRNMAVECTNL